MKKLLIVLLLLGCSSREDQCGTITNLGSDSDFSYSIFIDGTKHDVDLETFNQAYVGKYIFLQYD
jgi:hypothetical protein